MRASPACRLLPRRCRLLTARVERWTWPDERPGPVEAISSVGGRPGMSRIYYTKPSITELETRYAADAAASGWGERCYEYIERFEDEFRRHLGVKHAIATSSCTGATHMGLAALGVGPGDEVIVADINWIASVAPI